MTLELNTPVAPSRICFGTSGLGSAYDKQRSFAVLDRFAELGGTFIDTAKVYAEWLPGGEGASETTLGEWLKATDMRDQVVLATKGAHPPLDNMKAERGSRADLEHDIAVSLDRLGVDCIDLYWLHRDAPSTPVGEIVEILVDFINRGLIRAYGGSNWSWDRLREAIGYAEERALPPMVASQPGWSLADPKADWDIRSHQLYTDDELRQCHEKTGFPLVAYSAQAQGFFGEQNVAWARDGFHGPAPRGMHYNTPENRARLKRTIEMAGQKGCTANQLALAWLLCQPFPVYAIAASGNPGHVEEAWGALDIELTPQELRELGG